MVVMLSVAFLPTEVVEGQSYFNCGRRAEKFHPVVIVISPLNALAQIDAKKKNKNVSRKTYSFLKVKLRQSLSWVKINMIFAIATRTLCLQTFLIK